MSFLKFILSVIFVAGSVAIAEALPTLPPQIKSQPQGDIVDIPALRNPDRGYHIECNLILPNLYNPFSPEYRDFAQNSPYLVYDTERKIEARDSAKHKLSKVYDHSLDGVQAHPDSVTLIQQYIYLTPWVKKPLNDVAFDSMSMVFECLKEKGMKAILRYAYNWKGLGFDGGETEEMILHHIHQLTPFIWEHLGQIATLQAGFIGAWGEWHSSTLKGNQHAKNALVSALLEALPDPYCLEIRYPAQKRKLSLWDESKRGRLGYNNDYFTAGEHSHAPENDYVGFDYEDVLRDVRENNPFVSAEIPYAEKSEWGLHDIINPYVSLKILNEHRYTAFDITQNFQLNITSWKSVKLSADLLRELNIRFDERYFRDEQGQEVVRSMYQFVRDHLGYRFNVKSGARFAQRGHTLKYDFTVTNSGFARPINPKAVYLVVIREGKVVKEIPLDVDTREWLPMEKNDEDKMAAYRLAGKVSLEEDYSGCQIGLWMPEKIDNMKYNAATCVKFALNDNITHWWSRDGRYAVNLLGYIK